MRILIIGNGGREHAIAWKIAQSTLAKTIFVAPGNAGTGQAFHNIAIPSTHIEELLKFAQQSSIDLTIVGPEAPLAAGIVDQFTQANQLCVGPCAKAAQLEASKAFSKAFMKRHGIPTANYAVFQDARKAIAYLDSQSFPLVIKADGLAGGKGVVIAQNHSQAQHTIQQMLLEKQWGLAGETLIIEQYLTGEEVSFMVITDGEHYLPLASSQDHKARDKGDTGPNTGGMGAYSPAPALSNTLEQQVIATIIEPTIKGMAKEGLHYTGFLYAGLMIGETGDIHVLEFNCRLGDPETQVLMMRLKTDLVSLCQAAVTKQLNTFHPIDWDPRYALGVVLTSAGYPHQYQTGKLIQGLDQPLPTDTAIFHAGTTKQQSKWITAGGRVLCVTALGDHLKSAKQSAYSLANRLTWDGCYYRTDIGEKGLKLIQQIQSSV